MGLLDSVSVLTQAFVETFGYLPAKDQNDPSEIKDVTKADKNTPLFPNR